MRPLAGTRLEMCEAGKFYSFLSLCIRCPSTISEKAKSKKEEPKMLLFKSFREELIEKISDVDPAVFIKGCGKGKADILKDGNLVDQMWAVYQKDIEDYDMDAAEAFQDTLKDVLGIPAEG